MALAVTEGDGADPFERVRYIADRAPLPPGLHPVPEDVDTHLARKKLDTLGIAIDRLTDAQRRYLGL